MAVRGQFLPKCHPTRGGDQLIAILIPNRAVLQLPDFITFHESEPNAQGKTFPLWWKGCGAPDALAAGIWRGERLESDAMTI